MNLEGRGSMFENGGDECSHGAYNVGKGSGASAPKQKFPGSAPSLLLKPEGLAS